MGKKLVKILIMGVMLVMCLGLFVGCGGNKYNAVVLSDDISFRSEFLNENRTLNARYLNESWNEETDEWDDRYLVDKISPECRTFVVRNQDELNAIFDSFVPVDFEKEMVLLYCYTDIYSRQQLIDKVNLNGTALEIEFSLKKPKSSVGDAHEPGCKQLIIKMDALEINIVNFIKK